MQNFNGILRALKRLTIILIVFVALLFFKFNSIFISFYVFASILLYSYFNYIICFFSFRVLVLPKFTFLNIKIFCKYYFNFFFNFFLIKAYYTHYIFNFIKTIFIMLFWKPLFSKLSYFGYFVTKSNKFLNFSNCKVKKFNE